MTFLDLAEKVLTEEERPLTYNEIWQIAEQKDYILKQIEIVQILGIKAFSETTNL